MSATLAPRPSPTMVVRTARRAARQRETVTLVVAALAVFSALLVRVLLGDFQVSFVDFLRILGGENIPGASFIVWESKLPRALLGLLVGVSLGLGGAIFQSLLRNPLASPDVIGISMGASASAIFAIVVLGFSGQAVAVSAILGALAIAMVVRALARGHAVESLVVTGVVMGALLLAVVQYLLTRANIYDAETALVWLTGSVADPSWGTIGWLASALALLLPLIGWLWRAAAALELGRQAALALGVAQRTDDLLLALATVCVASGVAAAGPVAFVSFLAGPLSRGLLGGRLNPALAALVGALLVLVGDFIGGELLWELNLPVGVVTGACGAPFLLALLILRRGTR